MNQVKEKIKSLENLVEEREQRLNKKIKMTILIYGFLAIFVGVYTSVVVPKIKELTSPDNVTEIVKGYMSEYLTVYRKDAVKLLHENSDMWAASLVQQGVAMIPELEDPILQQFDNLNDYLVERIENALIPAFITALKENAPDLKERYAEFRDEEKMQGLSLIFIEIFETEMDQYLNEKFVSEVFNLQKKLLNLSRSDAALTKKQDAQRRILVNWLYLAETEDVGNSPISACVDMVTNKFRDLMEADDGADDTLEEVGAPQEL